MIRSWYGPGPGPDPDLCPGWNSWSISMVTCFNKLVKVHLAMSCSIKETRSKRAALLPPAGYRTDNTGESAAGDKLK